MFEDHWNVGRIVGKEKFCEIFYTKKGYERFSISGRSNKRGKALILSINIKALRSFLYRKIIKRISKNRKVLLCIEKL